MSSQTINALITLRELILNGDLRPGERLLELTLVERLGVSRTPVRAALARLAEEGLLEKANAGGYAVREFSERDIQDAIEARGTLEGMAARLAAERGANPTSLQAMKRILRQFDDLLLEQELDSEDIERYFELNAQFHDQLVALAESFIIEHMMRHVVALPFASPNAFVMAQSELGQAWTMFLMAQGQQAIENREGARADSLTQEHARLSLQNLRTALRTRDAIDQVPGLKLVYPSQDDQN
jgi:GntR family transcriptional regulator of vanillate catabolism